MQEDFVEEEEEDQWNGWQAGCQVRITEGLCLFPGNFRVDNEYKSYDLSVFASSW
jgi:hypothetical protein